MIAPRQSRSNLFRRSRRMRTVAQAIESLARKHNIDPTTLTGTDNEKLEYLKQQESNYKSYL